MGITWEESTDKKSKRGLNTFFLKSSRVDFDISMKTTIDNQQIPIMKNQGHFYPIDVAGNGEMPWRT